MAVPVDPISLVESVLNIADKIRTLVNDFIQASDAWKDFSSKVGTLSTKLNVWKTEVDDLGLSWDETVVECLKKAEELLKEEEENLKRKEDVGCASGFCPKLIMTLFPARIDGNIMRVTAALDSILKATDEIPEIRERATKRALARPPSLGFRRDNRYVRLRETEKEVRNALTTDGGPTVVLLHGGTGKGKSCLARDVALQVERSEDEPSVQQSDLATSSSTDANRLADAFEKVAYIECGKEAQISTVQLALLQKLGRDVQGLGDQKGEVDSTAQTRTILKGMLHNKKILIILDDLWSESTSILQHIIGLCGRNVKCLVTSQSADLCRPLNCMHQGILMERINFTDARKILASHILGRQHGVSDEMYNIPKYLEFLADEIIKKVDANPLAMACVATAIHFESFHDERTWQKVVEDFLYALQNPRVLTAKIQKSGHPYSFWAAMQLSVESLTKEERKVFILVSSCTGPSVPEEVVEYLCKLLKVEGFSELFLTAKKQLEDRQLIQVRERSLSIHSLLQEFVDRILQADKSKIISQLKKLSKSGDHEGIANSGREVDMMRAIINLYLDDPDFTPKMTDITTDTLNVLNERRYVIEPVTCLLLSDLHGTSTPRSQVMEVFLAYMKAGSIHEGAAITLLDSSNPKGIAVMMDVLVRFAQADANSNVPVGNGIFSALLTLLGEKDLYKNVYSMAPNDLLSRVADAVVYLHKLNADHGEAPDFNDTTLSTSFRSALEEITTTLAIDDNHHLQRQAMSGLWSLSTIMDAVVNHKIASPRLLQELINILNEDENKDGESAAIILRNLAIGGGQQVCHAIVSLPTAVKGLLNALTRDNKPHFQAEAARALAILADKGGESIAVRISRIPQSLDRLVHALIKTSNPELQRRAAVALAELALEGGRDVCVQISDVPTVLESLSHALEMDSNPDFQTQAARALDILADKGGESIAVRVSCIPQSLDRLVHALAGASNPKLQHQAAWALGRLAWRGNHDLCVQLSDVPTALESLSHGVEMDSSPRLFAS